QQLICNFEDNCDDFIVDSSWGLTNGFNPTPLNYDHTYYNESGHYIFYIPIQRPYTYSKISSKTWIEPPSDKVMCLNLYYYAPQVVPFYIDIVRGDQGELINTVETIQTPALNWTLVSVTLPSEKIKINIKLNSTTGVLLFDDISIDYCIGPLPSPTKSLYNCDFESDTCGIVTLANYPYLWNQTIASDAITKDPYAPLTDFTYKNSSGHYYWSDTKQYQRVIGGAGYFATPSLILPSNITSYCLNFEYYAFGPRQQNSNLRVLAWTKSTTNVLYRLWPPPSQSQYSYRNDQWTWGIINLPIGEYSLLFRIDNQDIVPSSFAIDNLNVTTCQYPLTTLNNYSTVLSFSCNFDDNNECGMENWYDTLQPDPLAKNYTLQNGNTIPDKDLGPLIDHTTGTEDGSFLYWHNTLPYEPNVHGRMQTLRIETNAGSCVRFSYYVKSKGTNNGTLISAYAAGCYGKYLWLLELDDSKGWQTITASFGAYACTEAVYFEIKQSTIAPVAYAIDDIMVDQCTNLPALSTTTVTTSTTSTTSTTHTTSNQTSTTSTTGSTSITITTSTSSQTTSATSTFTSIASSTRNEAVQNKINLKNALLSMSFFIIFM
ncbi:unnamed protein product, partial [Didymodactylos carnosus]